MPAIFKYIISAFLCLFVLFSAQAQENKTALQPIDSVKTNIVDTLQKDSTNNKTTAWQKFKQDYKPISVWLGVDIIKTPYTLLDKDKLRLEASVESFLTNKNWATLQMGIANAKFAAPQLTYQSTSIGAVASLGKSLFGYLYNKDVDNAFVGLGYGISYSRVAEATYTIADLWDTQNGIVPASNRLVQFAEINAGFRIALAPKWIVGWRMQAKAMLSNTNSSSLPALYVANYGSGEKSTAFGFNCLLQYQLF